MSSVTQERTPSQFRQQEGWPANSESWQNNNGTRWPLILGSVAALGLAALAIRQFGPDLVRYLKIERM